MSHFGDLEAEESERDGADEEEEDIDQMRKHKGKDKRKKQIDSDEEDEDDDEEVVKDLIDDNPIEEDSDNESVGSRKRKKSDEDDFDDRLEDDDYDLLEENLGVKVKRKKGFKRIRQDEESDVEETQDQGDDREAIHNQLFEGSDNETERPARRDEVPAQYASDESDVDSETDDFIVDDKDQPITDKRRKRKPIFTDAAHQEAQDIFGVDFDYEDLEKEEEEYDEEDEEDEDEYENEEQQTARRTKKALQRKKKLKSLYELYEPHELERAGLTEEDNRIRNTDVPERMQLRIVPVTPADEDELEEEAEWIFKLAFSKRTFSSSNDKAKSGDGMTPAPTSVVEDWGDDWEKQSGIVVPGPAASVISTTSKSAAAPTEEEDWENGETASSVQVPKAVPAPTEEEDWENGETASSVQVSRAVAAPPESTFTKIGGVDEDENWDRESNWEKQSVIGTSSMVGDASGSKSVITTAASAIERSVIQVEVEEEVKSKVIAKIKKALEFMRNLHLEVPFIAFYRKEYIQPELKINDLWKIYKLDARFCQLRIRKNRLTTLFKNMLDYQMDLIMEKPEEPLLESMRIITEDDIDLIRTLKTSEELEDIYLLFSLYYSDDVQAMKYALGKKRREEKQRARESAVAAADGEDNVPIDIDPEQDEIGGLKRKIGRGAYSLCRKLGIDGLVKKFGLPPDKFAENLRDHYQKHEVEQYPTDPVETAKEYLNERLKSEDETLKAAKFMLATQISREPLVRSSVREVFFERANLTVYPSKKGIREIDEAHPCYGMKYLNSKPVRDLKQDQFLKLVMAEEDKLLNIVIGDQIKGLTTDTYVEEVMQLFIRDEFSKVVQDWNKIRGECVQFALEKLLYPVFRKELKAKLLDEAKEHVIETSTQKLNQWLKVAPYTANFSEEDDEDWDTSKGIRILAIAYVPDYTQASFATIISTDGEPSEFIRLQNIMKNAKSFNESDRKEKLDDLKSIKELVFSKKPHVIVIGGESREAMSIRDDIRTALSELVSEGSFPNINVEILDNELSKVYANSTKAQTDFREFPLVLRQAISLGRRMQDPLIEFAQLVNHDDEILCLRFHPMQDQVSKEELLDNLTTQFVNRTNEVGVDINRCISCPFTMNVSQFICGLGPRKATALLKTLKQNNQRLENRTQLVTECRMGPKIFINCSGFIKIDTNALGDSTDAYVEALDGSRVHPEAYEWARKMAVDALEYDDENDDANPASALEEILENPKILDELNLDAFAEELQRQDLGNKNITLYDIRTELNDRYKDHRTSYIPPTGDQLFNMLTKETPETLYMGKLTTASVVGVSYKKPEGEQLDNAEPVRPDNGTWQCAFCKNDFPSHQDVFKHYDNGCPGQAIGIRIRFDNGINGFIPITKLSDKPVTNPDHRVRRGQTISCRILRINVDKFFVDCTSRTSDLTNSGQEYGPPKDVYYDAEAEKTDIKKEEDLNKKKHLQTYVRRLIVHPSFKNISYGELILLMEQLDQGEVIIRPSSKGCDHLTVSWKVTDGIYQHVDVKEERKEKMFSLGQSLHIGDEEFEDLDEIISRYVNPMASHARDLISYKYYVGSLRGSHLTAEAYLREEKNKNANKIHYVVHPSKECPGKFMISYLPGSKAQHEFITVTPDGFRYRQQTFQTLNATLNWFKEHFKEPPPNVATSLAFNLGLTPYAIMPRGVYDAGGKIGPFLPSHFTTRPSASHTAPPNYTTPIVSFSPYSAFTPSHMPFTATAGNPYIKPHQTPYQSGTTPKTSTPQNLSAGRFLHPGSLTPGGHKSNSQKPPQLSQSQPLRSRTQPPISFTYDDGRDRKAQEAWERSLQRTPTPGWVSRPQRPVHGASQNYMNPNMQPLGARPLQITPQPSRSIQQSPQLMDGNKNAHGSPALNFLPTRSPHAGRDSLKSTPGTNFSPRSMVESPVGDETPLYDEN